MKAIFRNIPLLFPGLLLAVGIRTFFSPCVHADGTASTCAGCGQAIFCAAIVLIVLAAVRMFLRTAGQKAALDGVLALISGIILCLPVFMKTCMLQTMRCNSLMKPAVWLIGGISLAAFLILLVLDIRAAKEK